MTTFSERSSPLHYMAPPLILGLCYYSILLLMANIMQCDMLRKG